MTVNLVDYALAAHYRGGHEGDPCRMRCDVWDRERPGKPTPKTYISLADQHRLIAVYRLRKNGRLFRMKRWPAAIRYDFDPGREGASRLLIELMKLAS